MLTVRSGSQGKQEQGRNVGHILECYTFSCLRAHPDALTRGFVWVIFLFAKATQLLFDFTPQMTHIHATFLPMFQV